MKKINLLFLFLVVMVSVFFVIEVKAEDYEFRFCIVNGATICEDRISSDEFWGVPEGRSCGEGTQPGKCPKQHRFCTNLATEVMSCEERLDEGEFWSFPSSVMICGNPSPGDCPSAEVLGSTQSLTGVIGCYCKINGGIEKEQITLFDTPETCLANNSVSVAPGTTSYTDCEWTGSNLNLEKIETPPSQIPLPEGIANLNRFGSRSIPDIIGGVIKAGTGIIGSIFLLMLVYGGVLIMISSGNAEQMKKGTNILVWSALGIVVILASYAIVNFIFGVF